MKGNHRHMPMPGQAPHERVGPRLIIVAVVAGVGISIVSISIGEGGPNTVAYEERGEVQGLDRGDHAGRARAWARRRHRSRSSCSRTCARFPAATFQAEVVDPIIEEYVREGRAQISIRHFSFGRSGVTEAAIASTAAGEQGHQWQFAEIVMRNLENAGPQGIDENFLKGAAEVTPGLEIDEWDEAFAEELEAQIDGSRVRERGGPGRRAGFRAEAAGRARGRSSPASAGSRSWTARPRSTRSVPRSSGSRCSSADLAP